MTTPPGIPPEDPARNAHPGGMTILDDDATGPTPPPAWETAPYGGATTVDDAPPGPAPPVPGAAAARTELDPTDGTCQDLLPADPLLPDGYSPLGVIRETARTRLTRYQHSGGGRDVVVKVFRTRREDLPQVWAAWNAAAAHAPLIPIEDSGLLDGAAWELTEYRPAGSLDDRPLPLSADELRTVAGDVCDALEALHASESDQSGLVHRDLTPANILIRSFQPLRVELIDTELAQHTGGAHSRDPVIAGGTDLYMAPEADLTVHPPGDYWSLGIVLAYLGTGRHPYQMRGGHYLSPEQVRRSRRERLPTIPEGLSAPMGHLVRGLITRDSNHRFGPDETRACLAGQRPPLPLEHLGGAPYVPPNPPPAGRPESGREPDQPVTPPGFEFDGLLHTHPESLAQAMAGHWTLAAQTLLGRGGHLLLRWLEETDEHRAAQFAATRAPLAARVTTIHRAIAETILILDSRSPATFHGYEIDRSQLLALARSARAGDAAATAAIAHLADGRVLEVLARHPEQDSLALVATSWHETLDSARALLRRFLPEEPPGYDTLLPAIVLEAVLDRRSAKDLTARARELRDDVRLTLTPWFGRLASAGADPLAQAAALITAQRIARTLPLPVRPELDDFARAYLHNAMAQRNRPLPRARVEDTIPLTLGGVAVVVALGAHLWALTTAGITAFVTAGILSATAAGILAHRWRSTPRRAAALITAATWGCLSVLIGACLVSAAHIWRPEAVRGVLTVAWTVWALSNLLAVAVVAFHHPSRIPPPGPNPRATRRRR